MGLHTGVHHAITVNRSDGRARLPPSVLSAAKAIGDAGNELMTEDEEASLFRLFAYQYTSNPP